MQQLLDQLTHTLAPQLAGTLAERFDLDPATAGQAIPAIARPLLADLQEKAEHPARNAALLARLAAFLKDDERPDAPEAAPPAAEGDDVASLLDGIAGGGLDGLAGRVAGSLGVEPGTARSLLLFVAPKIFALLRGKARQGGLEAVLGPLLGEGADVAGVLKLLQGAGALGGLSKRLGGLFGG